MNSPQESTDVPAVTLGESWHAPLNRVTTLSKITAAIVFVTLPFVGFYYGHKIGVERVWNYQDSLLNPAMVTEKIIPEGTTPSEQNKLTITISKFGEKTYPEEIFLSENLVRGTEFLFIGEKCVRYMGGQDCVIAVTADNSYGLAKATLSTSTPGFSVSQLTLSEVRVTEAGKLFMSWVFGDAGHVLVSYGVWDTLNNTYVNTSGWGGSSSGSGSHNPGITISTTGSEGTTTHFTVLGEDYLQEGQVRTVVTPDNIFANYAHNSEYSTFCSGIDVHPVVKNRLNPTSSWLLAYYYSCYIKTTENDKTHKTFTRYYEFDPQSAQVVPLTGIFTEIIGEY